MSPQLQNPSNPFPGLRPFEMEEDYLFFGRETQTAQLVSRLRQSRFLAVVGSSGSGKSSLVRAGMIPTLLAGRMQNVGSKWEVATMRPGGDPIAHLTRALGESDLYDSESEDMLPQIRATLTRSRLGLVEAVRQSQIESGANLLLLIDQFEEVFRFRRSGALEREQALDFVNLLLEASAQREQSIYVVITMRSDFIGDCSQFTGLAEAVNEGEFLIPRLSRQQCQMAIEGPVKVGGARIAPRLVQRLLNDLGEDQDHLPILQHALMRTWDRWTNEPAGQEAIDLGHYQAIGGMSEALSQHADEVCQSLGNDQLQKVAANLFKALTERGADNRGTRRPTRLGHLTKICAATLSEVSTVIEAFRKPGVTFLMPQEQVELESGTVIDISHESLMRVWRRLGRWVEEEAQSARVYRRLAESADLHQEGQAGLYRDPDLQIAASWRETESPNEAWGCRYYSGFGRAMEFLETSRQARDAEIQAKEHARQRELEQAKTFAQRMKKLVAVLGLVSLLAIIASVVALALVEKSRFPVYLANLQQAQLAIEQGRGIVASSFLEDCEESLRDWEWRYLKLQTDQSERTLQGFESAISSLEFSQDGDKILASSLNGRIRMQSFQTEETIFEYPQVPDPLGRFFPSALSPDGNRVAFRNGRYIEIWEADERMIRIEGDFEETNDLEFSYDGKKLLATKARDGTDSLTMWDSETGSLIRTLEGPQRYVFSAIFNSNATQVASGGEGGVICLWDAETGELLETFESGRVWCLRFSPYDRHLVASGEYGNVSVFELATGTEIQTIPAHSRRIFSLQFSPDGRLLAVGTGRAIKLFETRDYQLIGTFLGHDSQIWSMAFHPSGQFLISGDWDGKIKSWKVQQPYGRRELIVHQGRIGKTSFHADGSPWRSDSAFFRF